MQQQETSVTLSPIHRVFMIMAIIAEHLLYLWSMVLYLNYNSIRIPYIDYPSVIPPEQSTESTSNGEKTHYVKNVILYIAFWGQHIIMATFKYKLTIFRQIKAFVLYERYLYNIVSCLMLCLIYANLEPTYDYVFTIPKYICYPMTALGIFFLARSEVELGDKILMPYKIDDILNSKSVTYTPYDGKGFGGLKMDGVYAWVRHPLQCGMLSLLIFANGVYTVDKILNVLVMGAGVFIGVRMEQHRMLTQFKDYKSYMDRVKAKYIPYLHFLWL